MGESFFEVDATTAVVVISAIGVLLLQLFLCFKVKQIFVKLIPIAALIVSTIVFSICSATINGWEGFEYLFFALLSFGLIFVCGIGWGVWAVARKRS